MNCDNCGDHAATILYQNRDYISGEAFPLLRCRTCGLVRTQFDQPDLSRYYNPAYYGTAGKRFPAPMEWAVGRFRAARVKAITAYHPQPGRILDIGCGRGMMLAEFQKRGWEAIGTEFSTDLAQAVEKQHGLRVYTAQDVRDCHFKGRSFDVITLWHVLEHLTHPVQTLQEIGRILKPGGILLIEVPNLSSWQARLGGGRWFHLDCPRHLYHFSQASLTHLLGGQGFQPLHSQTLSLEYGFYGFYQTLLNRLTWQPNVLYARLKKSSPAAMGLVTWQKRWDDLITLVSLPGAVVAGTFLELAAVRNGQGGIVRIIARRGGS